MYLSKQVYIKYIQERAFLLTNGKSVMWVATPREDVDVHLHCSFSSYTHMLFLSPVHADAASGMQLGKRRKKAHFGNRRPS